MIYVGALYTPARVTSAAQAMEREPPKMIRMHFAYDEAPAQKLRDGFAESIDNNVPGFSKTAEAQKLLNVFNCPAVKTGPIATLFAPQGPLPILHNGKQVGRIVSAATSQAVRTSISGPNRQQA